MPTREWPGKSAPPGIVRRAQRSVRCAGHAPGTEPGDGASKAHPCTDQKKHPSSSSSLGLSHALPVPPACGPVPKNAACARTDQPAHPPHHCFHAVQQPLSFFVSCNTPALRIAGDPPIRVQQCEVEHRLLPWFMPCTSESPPATSPAWRRALPSPSTRGRSWPRARPACRDRRSRRPPPDQVRQKSSGAKLKSWR